MSDVGASAAKQSAPTKGMIGCFQPGISLSPYIVIINTQK